VTAELFLVILIILIALAFDFLNGMNDAANSVATIVSTRVLKPRWAVAWAAFFNFVAAFAFGTHVAKTIGKGIVQPQVLDNWVILSTLVGAVFWTYLCTHYGLPISVSHSLVGGLIGAGIAKAGLGSLVVKGITKVAIFIMVSPLVGLMLGLVLMIITAWIVRRWTPHRVDSWFRRLQLLSAAAYSLGHGTNDAQKTMGVIAALLFATQLQLPAWLYDRSAGFYVPFWVVITCHFFIATGTMLGGWRVIRTLGIRVTKLQPIGGFCAETAGAITLLGTALGGIPVSTTHTITGAIMGVGAAKRLSAVRWGVARRIIWAWVLTIPCSALVAAGVYEIVLLLRSL
jgi:PiT family inorganic phosphate transporter